MAASYDEGVIVTYAEQLYARSMSVMIAYTLLGGIGGVLLGVGFREEPLIIIGAAALGAAFGAKIGSDRGFALRLLAQQALCQVQIERNTRGQIQREDRIVPAERTASEARDRPGEIQRGSEDPELKTLLQRAQDCHFAKRFPEAVTIYQQIIARFPDSKQASVARLQLKNLQ